MTYFFFVSLPVLQVISPETIQAILDWILWKDVKCSFCYECSSVLQLMLYMIY